MKLHRRNNMIDIYTSLAFNIKKEINICTDAGRPIRPLFYMMADNKISYERKNVLNKYKNNNLHGII